MIAKLAEFSRNKPFATLTALAALSLLGLIALTRIPISLMPGSMYPGLTVEVQYLGITPDKIEEVITRPLEDSLSTVGGIEDFFSTSEQGRARIHMQFGRNTEVNLKSLEVRERVELVSSSFPKETQKPVILKYDPEKRPVMILILDSKNRDLSAIREVADREIKRLLEGVQGISEVYVAGGRDREVLVDTDRPSLDAHGISMRELLQALQAANVNASVGRIKNDGGEYDVMVKSRFSLPETIRNVVLRAGEGGAAVRVDDVADVKLAYRDPDSTSRVNGNERVSLYVHRAGTGNLLDISSDVRTMLAKNRIQDLNYEILYDQSDVIRKFLGHLSIVTALGACTSTLVMLLILRSFKRAVTPLIPTPLAFLISILVLFLLRMDLNSMSIVGLVIGCGIAAFQGMWISAAFNGTQGIQGRERAALLPLALMVAALVPLVFANQEFRVMYGGLAAAVVISIAIGSLVSAVCLPALEVLLFREMPRQPWRRFAFIGKMRTVQALDVGRRRLRTLVLRTLPGFYVRLGARPDPAMFGAFALCITAIGIAAAVGLHTEFVNPFEKNRMTVHIELPSGSSFATTDAISKKVEKKLRDTEDVIEVSAKVETDQSDLMVKFSDNVTMSTEFVGKLRAQIGTFEPAFIYLSKEGDATSFREITVDVLGPDLAELDRLTKALSKKMEGVPGVSDVVLRYKSPRPELQVIIDKAKAESVGLSSQTIGEVLRYAIQGGVATKFEFENREMDVRIRYKHESRSKPEDLNDIQLKSQDNLLVPLREVSRLAKHEVPVKIYRKGKKRVLSFSFRPASFDAGDVLAQLKVLDGFPLPEGYRLEYGKEFHKLVESRQRFTKLAVLAALLVVMILAAAFESLKRPWPTIAPAALPISAAFIGLFVLRQAMTVQVIVALVVLAALAMTIFAQFLSPDWARLGRREKLNIAGAMTLSSLWFVALALPGLLLPGEARGLVMPPLLVLSLGLALIPVLGPAVAVFDARSGAKAIWLERSTILVRIRAAILAPARFVAGPMARSRKK